MAPRRLGAGVIALIVIDAILLVVFLALLLTRPTDPEGPEEARAEPAPSLAAQVVTKPAPTASARRSPEPVETPEHAIEVPADARDEPAFASPSRNIWCEMGGAGVTCTIGGHEYTPPENPECPGQTGRVVHLTEEEASMPCITEAPPTSAPDSFPELDYGQASLQGEFLCESEETGMTCRSLATGRGFTLAYREVELF